MMIVILDNIRSVHNVASIFRTADGAGIEKLYLCGVTPIPTDRFGVVRKEFAKVALGAEESVDWEYCAKTASALVELKKKKYVICALEQSPRSIRYDKLPKKISSGKIALVAGNEVEGLSSAMWEKADYVLEIPMRGKKESLNVSVAFGIAAYALLKG